MEDNMRCPKCNTENKEGRKFCSKCGSKLENVCPKCGYKNDLDDTFCGECGVELGVNQQAISRETTVPKLEDMHSQLQSLIPDILAQKYLTAEQHSGENRPITAIFADISGFTPLSATKSSETMFRLVQDCFKQLVSIVASYEGSISGFRGDGLLALFGAPIIHENDAERALLAAIDMRNAMRERQLEISVGINTATMTVGEIETELHKEYTAYSIDINLAKRLQESAKPGQIMVGTGTYRLTRKIFDFEELPSLQLKGFANPVTAYSFQKIKAHPEKLRGIEGMRARMVGRDEEFEKLIDSTNEWLDGKGQIVSIIGEAGIGKSRLVSELKEYLGKDEKDKLHLSSFIPHPFLEGRCISIGQSISYWPFLDILRGWLNISGDDTEIEIIHKTKEQIGLLMPDRIDDILPYFGQLMNLKFGDEVDNVLKNYSPEQVKHGIMIRLRDIFIALSQRNRLMLILEDLHWTDELSLDLIHLLMDELMSHPIMLVCVYRPEQGHNVIRLSNSAQRKCPDRYTKINIDKLSSSESRRLVSELLAIDNLPDSVRDMIISKSEGNPFFIEEVIRSLMERGLVYKENERWKANDDIIELEVPDTIQSVLLERIDRLEAEAKYVLQCASVIGRLFKYNLLDHITQKQKELDKYLDEFEERDLAYQERTVPEMEYAFKHALTQDATYQGILEQRRMAFHRNVALGIEKLYQERIEEFYEELAHHWERSKDKEKTLEYLIKAGQKTAGNYLNKVAIDYYTHAIKLAKDIGISGERLADIYKGRGQLYRNMGFYEEAISDMEEATTYYTNHNTCANIYQSIATIYAWSLSDMYEARKYAHKAINEVDSNDKSREVAEVYGGVANILKGEEGIPLLLKAVNISEEMEYRDLLSGFYKGLCYNYRFYPGSIDMQKLLIAHNKSVSYLNYCKSDLSQYATICAELSIFSEDEERIYLANEGLQAGIKSGNVWATVVASSHLGSAYQKKGEILKAIEAYQQGWQIGVRMKHIYGFNGLLKNLMYLYVSQKELSKLHEMMLQMIDSTLELHSRSKVHNTLHHEWNSILEEVYEILHSIDLMVYHELERSLESRLNENNNVDEQFFYTSQLMLSALIDNRKDDVENYSKELIRLRSNAGIYAERMPDNIKWIIELMPMQVDQLELAIGEYLEQIKHMDDLLDGINLLDMMLSTDKIAQTLDWDQISQILLSHLLEKRGIDVTKSFLAIEHLYSKHNYENRLQSLVEIIHHTCPNVFQEDGTSQIMLQPVKLTKLANPHFTEEFIQDPIVSGWEWINLSGNCRYELGDGGNLSIEVLTLHDLYPFSNYNAPRLIRDIDGNFIIETCVTNGLDGFKYGGLLIWKNKDDYIRFEVAGPPYWTDTIYYGANINGKFIHPGVHPYQADRVWLRLERKGDRFTGYVSSDGENWYICGWTDIPMEDPIKVGIHALCPESPATSTRFEYFKIYRINKE
jgi:class 3 adenylate cyclase/regulation of enolase protein 1 (concanavalin A-like superfamily)/tetratricopeptide (TPR) repeat protein